MLPCRKFTKSVTKQHVRRNKSAILYVFLLWCLRRKDGENIMLPPLQVSSRDSKHMCVVGCLCFKNIIASLGHFVDLSWRENSIPNNLSLMHAFCSPFYSFSIYIPYIQYILFIHSFMFSANENIALRQHKRRVIEYVEECIPEDLLDLGATAMAMQVSCNAPGKQLHHD